MVERRMDEQMHTTQTEVDAKAFWNEQARKYGNDARAVNFDPIDNEFAPRIIERLVPDSIAVCDVGCGNGRTTLDLASSRPNGSFVGCDFSENMIASAEEARGEAGIGNVKFRVFDATMPSLPQDMRGQFDLVLTKRLLINVKGQAKRRVLENIHSMLKAGATYILIECFDAPLERINDIRNVIGLDRIRVRPFNEYLSDKIFKEIIDGLFEETERIDYSSLYYFISRIFNAGLSEGEPAYDAPINLLAARLIKAGVNPIQGYSPEVAYVLSRK
jgi:ubiquinone/menaquinone biosynthesis C-methylase UbiE